MYLGLSLIIEGVVFHSIGQNWSSVTWSVEFLFICNCCIILMYYIGDCEAIFRMTT